LTDFFVSYTAADRRWAQWIAWQLEQAGYSTVIQAWDFGPGGDFVEQMQRAVTQAERTIAVLSPAYFESRFGAAEWHAVFTKDPTGEQGLLVPVRVAKVDPPGLLASRVYVDLVGLNEPAARMALLDGLRRAGTRPAAAPGFPGAGGSAVEVPRFPGELPPIWNVPFLRNPLFTGRDDQLKALRAQLQAGDGAARRVVITGLGGGGKTQLAVEYAYRHTGDYDLVWWVRAATPASLLGDYTALAAKLDVAEDAAQDVTAAAVRAKLERQAGWLLIFDNAEVPTRLAKLLPQGGGGQVLVTSRRADDWRPLATPIGLDVLPTPQAARFLLARTDERDEAAATRLAGTLGGLPLALEQAGALIAQSGGVLSLAGYQAQFEQRSRELLGRGRPYSYAHTVDTTWELSLKPLRRQAPSTVELLTLAAFLGPDDLPWSLLSEHADQLPAVLAAAARDPVALGETVAALRRYSLVKTVGDGLAVHRLLQTVVREDLDSAGQQAWAGVAVRLLHAALPRKAEDVRAWPAYQRLLPHALAAVEHAQRLGAELVEAGWLVNRAGNYAWGRGQYTQAKAYLQQAMAVHEQALGAADPAVATDRRDLAGVLWSMGDYTAARPQVEQALAIHERTLGPDHRYVATDRSILGSVLRAQGDLAGARTQHEQALAIDEHALGPDHPEVATSRSNLGLVLHDQGDLAGARTQLERALAISEHALGPDHPDVATSRSNLGLVLQAQGDLAGARTQHERALAICERALSPDHPDVAVMRGNLASVLQAQGDLAGARAQFERALAIGERALGPDHPTVAALRRALFDMPKTPDGRS
jgi:tetratricopeptide (TPR) repeat protein